MTRPLIPIGLGLAGIGIGIGAEAVRSSWDEPGHWIPDLAVGWAMAACGLAAIWRRSSGTGPLLIAGGLTWFVGNFAALESPLLSRLAAQAVYLHRGVLVQAVLAFPGWRPATPVSRVVVVAAYATSVVMPLARSDVAQVALGTAVIAAALWDLRMSLSPARPRHLIVLRAAVALGLSLAGPALARLIVPGAGDTQAVLLIYQAALTALAVGLLVAQLLRTWERSSLTDLVVELAADRTGSVEASLARALGDPTLQVAYWISARGGYVDAAGEPFQLPDPTLGRTVTPVESEGTQIAVLIHDPALAVPGLADEVSMAAAISASNARLQAQVREQLGQVRASRRRLVEAAAEERRRLEGRMRAGAGRQLEEVARALTDAEDVAGSSNQVDLMGKLHLARQQLDRTQKELSELARGLYPPALGEGRLTSALAELADHSGVRVQLTVSAPKLPAPIAAVTYFFVAEALTNVAKHANATKVAVNVAIREGRLLVVVADDGVGGVDPAKGSGLRGLADRVEALAGSVQIESSMEAGTRLAAEIPLADQPRQAFSRP